MNFWHFQSLYDCLRNTTTTWVGSNVECSVIGTSYLRNFVNKKPPPTTIYISFRELMACPNHNIMNTSDRAETHTIAEKSDHIGLHTL